SEDNDFIYIGPAANFNLIQNSEIIRKYIPVLIDAVSKIGSHQIRNSGTIGGNLCTCASCADSAPILITYNAEVEICSAKGKRIVPLTEILLHHHRISISKNEILTKIIVPKPKANFAANFQKFGLRESASISVASVAVGLSVEHSIITDASIVVGACAPTPKRCPSAINKIINSDIRKIYPDSQLLNEIAEAASSDINPIDDIRGSAEYRREIVKIITKRAIINALTFFQ
ncbi:MAG: FAD binding domain-containing protein, partial [Bacteroidota bacterium]